MNASQQAKQRGARLYAAKDYAGAVACFSEAIERADGNDMDLHLYHSNRCAAYQQLGRWREALDDAEATTQIKPTWAKGWSRYAMCLERDPRRRGGAEKTGGRLSGSVVRLPSRKVGKVDKVAKANGGRRAIPPGNPRVVHAKKGTREHAHEPRHDSPKNHGETHGEV